MYTCMKRADLDATIYASVSLFFVWNHFAGIVLIKVLFDIHALVYQLHNLNPKPMNHDSSPLFQSCISIVWNNNVTADYKGKQKGKQKEKRVVV